MRSPIIFNEQACTGCNLCVEVCPMDVFTPQSDNRPPAVTYPEECRYCGACWVRCPQRAKGAIDVVPPPAIRVSILRGEPRVSETTYRASRRGSI